MPIKLTFPDDRKPDKAFVSAMESMFETAGISQQQADILASGYQQYVDGWMQADTLRMEAASAQAVDALKREWGGQFDANVASGRNAAASLGLDAKALDALDRGIGSAATMNLLAKLGARVTTDAGTGKSSIVISTPEDARAEIARLSGDKNFQDTLRDSKNPTARADALEKWESLHAQAYPAPKAPAASVAALARDLGLSSGTVDGLEKAAKDTSSKREAALARIEALSKDHDFQDRMRAPGPGREAAVQEWNGLYQTAYEPTQ